MSKISSQNFSGQTLATQSLHKKWSFPLKILHSLCSGYSSQYHIQSEFLGVARKCFAAKDADKNFANFTGKQPVPKTLFNKVAGF